MKINTNLYCIIILVYCSVNAFAQLKAYPDKTPVKDTIKREIFSVPEIAAEFPGGTQKMFKYLMDNFTNKITLSQEHVSEFRSPIVGWTIDETGKVIDVKIVTSSNFSSIDNLLKDVVNKMPLWKPAENAHKKVKHVFSVPIQICFK
jgi:hypothetical protein